MSQPETQHINVKVRSATFMSSDEHDHDVVALYQEIEGGKIQVAIDYGDDKKLVEMTFPSKQLGQTVAAMQFLTDTLGESLPGRMSPFVRGFISQAADAHHLARSNGFWPEEGRNDGELLALIHSEISECLEALRHGNPPDEKLPNFDSATVELADAIIRIMDMAHARGLPVAQAVEAKHAFNKTRPHKHGKNF